MESFFADSIKPQVLTTATSAASTSETKVQPSAARRPANSSESTSLRAQPIVTIATVRLICQMVQRCRLLRSESLTNLLVTRTKWGNFFAI